MRRTLNVKMVVGSLLVVAVCAGAVHLLHERQVDKHSGTLLDEARRAEEQGNLAEAATYLERYVTMTPDDVEAQARYGLLLEKASTKPRDQLRAFLVLEKAVRSSPERHDVRREVVRLAMALGRPGDARDHLNVLVEAFPEDSGLAELQAKCFASTAHFAEAADWYARAIKHGPERVDCYVERARLLRRRLQKPEEADRVMDQLVHANPRSGAAFLARGRYLGEFHSFDRAAADVAHARKELAPNDVEVILASADLDIARRRYEDARAHLRHGMELDPKDARLRQSMARLELHAGRRAEAIEHLRAAATTDKPLLLWTTADLFIDAREYSEAQTLVTRLEKTAPPGLVEYLKARLALADGNWAEARGLLERARQGLAGSSDLLKQTLMLLATCHEQLGNPDAQLACYRAALDIDAAWLPARLGFAAAALAAGRLDDAAGLYQKLAPQTPAARLMAVRLASARQLRLPAGQRRWDEVEALLEGADDTVKKTADWRILRAELWFVQGQADKAVEYLEAAQKELPKQVEIAVARVAMAVRQKQLERAAALLDQADKDLGDRAALRLVRAALPAGDRPSKETHALLRQLSERTDDFAPAERARLWTGLAHTALFAGDIRLAGELAEKVVALQPHNVEMCCFRFQLAMQDKDPEVSKTWLAKLTAAEGEDGPAQRYASAARLVKFTTADQQGAFNTARTALAEAAKLRPSWAVVPLLEAEICEKEGNTDAALDKYRQAVALGERNPKVVRRVVGLLHERRRYGEAQEVLRQLQEQTPLAGDLGRLATEASLLNHQDPQRTLELARKAVATDAHDYREFLWLGQVLSSLNQTAEAEKALRRAIELQADAPDPWVSLVFLLVRTKQTEAAEEALAEAQKKLGEKHAPLALAVCYEALGRRDKAEEQLKAALTAQPDDPIVCRTAASYFMRTGRPAEAQTHFRKLLNVGPEGLAPWTRRQLALALAMTGNYGQFQEALTLIDENLKKPGSGVEDQRARAVILAAQPQRRRDSIRALEESFAKVPPNPDERFLLARLYDSDGNWAKARTQLLSLASVETPSPLHLAYYVDVLMRRQEPREAAHWLTLLTKLEPQSWRTTQARARLLVQQGDAAGAVKLLKAYQGPEAGLVVAHLLEDLGQNVTAEELYRQLLAAADSPENLLALAGFLGRRGKAAEALDVCDRAADKAGPDAIAAIGIGILRGTPGAEKLSPRVEKRLLAALEKQPQSLPLQLILADLRDFQGRYAEAQELYRKVLKTDPKNPVANNNLAMLLVHQPDKAGEAVALSQKAIEQAGPAPVLLDTRAQAYLAAGQHERAVGDLEEAVAVQPTAPRYFHLAQAYRAGKNAQAAGQALQKAKSLGLTAQVLHPLERQTLEKFLSEPLQR